MTDATAAKDQSEPLFVLGEARDARPFLRAGRHNLLIVAALIWGGLAGVAAHQAGVSMFLTGAIGVGIACVPLAYYSRVALAVRLDGVSLHCVLPVTVWRLSTDTIGGVRVYEFPWWASMLLVVRGRGGRLLGMCVIEVTVTRYGAMRDTANALRAAAERLDMAERS